MKPSLVRVPYRDGVVDIEHLWINRNHRHAPLLVFLHEGLGSVSLWRDFPELLCERAGIRGLVYSRPGYGQSTRRPIGEYWSSTFMHEQARDLLPALLTALDVNSEAEPPWLFGHSDGGSIALIHAASFPSRVSGLVVVAPHIFVEELSIASIEATRHSYLRTELREKLARHHADPDSAFWGWNDIWLDPSFRDWNIEALLPCIRCPVLAVQGRQDQYGTMAQIEGIGRAVPQSRLLALDDCGHTVHRDQPERLVRATIEFMNHPVAA